VPEDKVRVLIVDDEASVRTLLSEVLHGQGYEVAVASNGEEAIELARKTPFEIVITDMRMPGISGVEVIQHMKNIDGECCVIVMTGFSSVESAVEAIRRGAYDYITKPFNIATMRIIVDRAAERQRLLKEARQKDRFEQLAILDGLTELHNKRYFEEVLEKEIMRAKRYHLQLGLLMIDVDDFKVVNDNRGHLVGDRLLQKLAKVLSNAIRRADVVARYGGDEFVIIATQSNKQDANNLAKRLLRIIQQTTLMDDAELKVTVSIGVSSYPTDGDEKGKLLESADAMLYKAKRLGKNRMCTSGEEN
jgi:diguanylate cyclase (GGDEF)-like protein